MKVYLRLLKATCALAMQPEVVGSPAASQRYLKRRLVNKKQYIRHLCHGESCSLPEILEAQIS